MISLFLLNLLLLSPGQTDWQVVASGRKLNLRKDLPWVSTDGLAKFLASTRKSQNTS